jgi:FkbM family methyltransferase
MAAGHTHKDRLVSQYGIAWQLRRASRALGNLGVSGCARYYWRKARGSQHAGDDPFSLSSRYAAAPLWCRPRTSDIDVFDQIYVDREYRCLDGIDNATNIIDCGANVGYASAYFLSRFPAARVVAVEPDRGNFCAAQRNLAPFGGRVRLIHSAVWSHCCGLVVSEARSGDRAEWGVTVREALPRESPHLLAVDIPELFRAGPFERATILKIDIEGAEQQVFSSADLSWLDRVDAIVIELHGAACAEAFHGAIRDRPFVVSTCDELTVCIRDHGREH